MYHDLTDVGLFPVTPVLPSESPSPQLQEAALAKIPDLADKMDYSAFKNSLFPRICTLCLETGKWGLRRMYAVGRNLLWRLLADFFGVRR